MLVLGGGGAVESNFVPVRHRVLRDDELLIGGASPLHVRQDVFVEHIKAGLRVSPAAPESWTQSRAYLDLHGTTERLEPPASASCQEDGISHRSKSKLAAEVEIAADGIDRQRMNNPDFLAISQQVFFLM